MCSACHSVHGSASCMPKCTPVKTLYPSQTVAAICISLAHCFALCLQDSTDNSDSYFPEDDPDSFDDEDDSYDPYAPSPPPPKR